MPEQTDKPDRDTSPSGEISARQNEDGTYEIVAGESTTTSAVPEDVSPKAEGTRSPEAKDEDGASIRSPLTIGLLVVTLLAAGGTVAYFATGPSAGESENASDEEDPSFRPYAGDDAPPPSSEEEPPAKQQAAAEADASSDDEDARAKQRKTEIIVLEEGVDESELEDLESGDSDRTDIDPSKFKRIDVGPGTAARIKDSTRLKVDPAKLRGIKFTNGQTPEAEGQEVRDRDRGEAETEDSAEGQPSEELQRQDDDPVIE
ncbi:MAG: hypothetical protein ACQEVA_01370 [Myxococcota bacterium]